MTVLMIIFGILMIVCGFSCMFTPLTTFLDAGYFIVILGIDLHGGCMVRIAGHCFRAYGSYADKGNRLKAVDIAVDYRYHRYSAWVLFLFPPGFGCRFDRIPSRILFCGNRFCDAFQLGEKRMNRKQCAEVSPTLPQSRSFITSRNNPQH